MIARAGSLIRVNGGVWRRSTKAIRFAKSDVKQTKPNTVVVNSTLGMSPVTVEIQTAHVAEK
jgi:hypothetical protein